MYCCIAAHKEHVYIHIIFFNCKEKMASLYFVTDLSVPDLCILLCIS